MAIVGSFPFRTQGNHRRAARPFFLLGRIAFSGAARWVAAYYLNTEANEWRQRLSETRATGRSADLTIKANVTPFEIG